MGSAGQRGLGTGLSAEGVSVRITGTGMWVVLERLDTWWGHRVWGAAEGFVII